MLVNSWQKRLPSWRRWDSMVKSEYRAVYPLMYYQTFAELEFTRSPHFCCLPFQTFKNIQTVTWKIVDDVASAGHRTILFLFSRTGFQDMLSRVFEVKSSMSIEFILFVYILFYLKPLGANSLFLFSPEYFATHQRRFPSERATQTRASAARKICRTNNSIDNRDGGASVYLPSASSKLDGTAYESQWWIP